MRMEVLFQGFPGKLTAGYMQWSSAILVESGEKKILFDTAGPVRRVNICPRLAEFGVSPEDIDLLVLSHFHNDHMHNYDFFSRAEILLHEAEVDYVEKGEDPWQMLPMFDVMKRSGRLRTIRDGQEIAKDVVAIHTPGHTPGCMSLVLSDPNKPVTVLAGDAVKNIAELATGRAAMSLDQEATSRSIVRVRSIAERVVPGHDRLLKVGKEHIQALEAARETITIPPDVADIGAPRRIELVLEPTRLAITR